MSVKEENLICLDNFTSDAAQIFSVFGLKVVKSSHEHAIKFLDSVQLFPLLTIILSFNESYNYPIK